MAYKVPFVDLPTQYQRLREELAVILEDVLFRRADFIMRGDLREFESNFASFVGVQHAVGVNSGTDALLLSLRAVGPGSGDEVITVAHTFVATIAAIVHCGATPILVDVGEDFNMDMEQLKSAISSRTRAIIPVHLNGRLCDMDMLMSIAEEHELIVIEDAAQAVGASLNGTKAGAFGLTGCFSLYPMKLLGGAGDGGIITTNDGDLAQKLRFLRDHGQNRQTGEIIAYSINSRLDNFHAAILNVKLRHLPSWIERRREIAEIYGSGLSNISELCLPHFPDSRYFDVYQNYVIRALNRDALRQYLNECGIELLVSWPKPLHHQAALGLSHFKLPVTEQICKEVLSLPMNTEISNEQVDYVIDCIRKFYA